MRVKVAGTGLGYDSIDEAVADVDRMEQLRDVEVGDLREAGNEAGADRAADRWDKQIQKTRDAIRGAQEREAGATTQPRNRPTKRATAAKPSARAGGDVSPRRRPRRVAARKAQRGFLSSFGRGTSGRVLRDTGAAAATSSTSKLALQLFGLLVGLALVLVVLEAEQAKRSVAGGAVDFLLRLVGAIVDPVDPFSSGAWREPTATPASVTSSAGTPRRTARPTIVRRSS